MAGNSQELEDLEVPVENKHLPMLNELLYEVTSEWEQFGNALGMNYDAIQSIRLAPIRREPKVKMMMVLKEIKDNDPDVGWEKIEKALKALRNNRLASKTKDKTGKAAEDEKKLLEFLKEEIPNWKRFGMHMGVSPDVLDSIDDKPTPEDCFEKLLRQWMKEKEATLAAVIRACRSLRNFALAQKLVKNPDLMELFRDEIDKKKTASSNKANGVCRVYAKGKELTVVVVTKDKADQAKIAHKEKNEVFSKEVTVESDISLELISVDGWTMNVSEPVKITKSQFDKGQLCSLTTKIEPKESSSNLKLKLVGVSPPENKIIIPLESLVQLNAPCTSST